MKGILICFLVLSAFCAELNFAEADTQAHEAEQLNFLIELLDGFLEGIQEQKKVTDLLTCLGNSEDIIKLVKEAIEMIVKGNVTEGLFKLFEIFKILEKQLEPCLDGFTQFKKLIAEIKELNYVLIIFKIAQHMNEIKEEIEKVVAAIEAKDFKVVGLGIGKILYMLLLEDKVMPKDNFVNFIKGFLLGLNEKGDITELLKCVKDLEHIIKKIEEAIKLLKDIKKLDKFIQGLVMLFQAVTELINMLKPCAKGFEQIKKLFEALKHIDIMKLAFKILANPNVFIQDIMGMIDGFKNNNLTKAGFCLGDFMFRLFLEERQENTDMEVPKDNFVNFIKGFLLGLNEKGDINELLKCIKDLEHIIKKIEEAIKLLKDIKKIDKFIQGLVMLFQAVTELINMLKPCAKGFEQIKKLFEALKHIDFMKLVFKIMANPTPFIQDIMGMIDGFKNNNLTKAGFCLGDFLYKLFLEERQNEPVKEEVGFVNAGRRVLKSVNQKLRAVPDFLKKITEQFTKKPQQKGKAPK
jgi:tetratricopeptide (TPR) repeat protein